MDWQSMVIFSLIFSVTNNIVSRAVSTIEHYKRGKELDKMLNKLQGVDQRLEKMAGGVRRVK